MVHRHPLALRYLQLSDGFIPCLKKLSPIPGWTTGYHTDKKTLRARFRQERWLKADRPFVVRWHRNIRIEIHPGEEISRCLYLEGAYEPNQMSFLKSALRPGSAFMDIGAHCGLYSLFASTLVRKQGCVIAVEPSAREFGRLERNIRLNRRKNIRTLRVAVSDKEGPVQLRVAAEPHTGHNTLRSDFNYPDTRQAATERVEATTVDRLAASEGISRLDVIKLDAEGSELGAIKGALKTLERFRPILLFEMIDQGNAGRDNGELWDLLRSLSYDLLAYDLRAGTPFRVEKHPGPMFADFIATMKNRRSRGL